MAFISFRDDIYKAVTVKQKNNNNNNTEGLLVVWSLLYFTVFTSFLKSMRRNLKKIVSH